jgi:REP element-mobilizing transposase RayT
MSRGIEASKIFTRKDREDFIDRQAELCRAGSWAVYAWALVPNHFHLVVRTGKEYLARSMRRLMTGYAINFNLRHKRRGYFFQNRYKSIVGKLGYPAAAVARFLGVTTSAVVRAPRVE